jgi:hypothetical protein
VSPIRDVSRTAVDYDPATATAEQRAAQARSTAIALIGRGLDLDPGNPWGMARDIAEALGLVDIPADVARDAEIKRRALRLGPKTPTVAEGRPSRAKGTNP